MVCREQTDWTGRHGQREADRCWTHFSAIVGTGAPNCVTGQPGTPYFHYVKFVMPVKLGPGPRSPGDSAGSAVACSAPSGTEIVTIPRTRLGWVHIERYHGTETGLESTCGRAMFVRAGLCCRRIICSRG